ncbi:MAG: tetratricopeptide repeat protein [Candidatus Aminicenantes bacterium]|nr:tetratricopeptide repeat protein [Candidatus Aminicenantes bacterium]
MKKIILISLLALLLIWSCRIEQIPSPQISTGTLPQSKISELSLDERIVIEEAWNDIKRGDGRRALNQVSKVSPENPFYYTITAYAYFLLNDFQRAEQYFKTALQQGPDIALTHLGLAQLYQKTQRDELAFIQYREVLKREPNQTWAKSRYEQIKTQKTMDTLQEAKDHLNQGNTQASERAYLKALYYSPDSEEAHSALADLYLKEGKYDNALIHLKTLLSQKPENKEALKLYADALFRKEEFKRSLEAYKDLKKLSPEDQEIENRIQQLKNRLGIFELPSQYDSIPSRETATNEDMAALIGVKFQKYLPDTRAEPPIIIDISTSWASEYILKLTSMEILDIYPNHTFKPKNIVTRAQLAEIIFRLINHLKQNGYSLIQQIPPQSIQLPDVSPNNFYYRPIIMALSYGILNTSMGGNFNPENPVSGQDALKAVNTLLSLIK